ncbi:MAG TPA: MoaD/ThiS family protein [Anaerolineales bacterium]|nr:MoaD/ThiS family protein [Anaerolineales bacterium]
MNPITVLFFANLRDVTGERKIVLEITPGLTIAGLKEKLINIYPELEHFMPAVIVSLNHEFAGNQLQITEDAEVAFFPPVSGGIL